MLQLTVAGGGSLALAGCMGGDDEDSDDTGDEGNGQGSNEPFVVPVNVEASQSVYAPYSGTLEHMGDLRAMEASWEVLGRTRTDGTREGWLLEDHYAEDGTVTLKLREDYTWSNGDPVTAEDLAAKCWLDHYESVVLNDVEFENVQIEDDYTVTYDFVDEDRNPELWFDDWMGVNAHIWPRRSYLDVKADLFEEWLEQFHDATTGDEVTSVWEEFDQWSLPLEDVPRLGPWQYDGDLAGRTHVYVANEEYPGLPHLDTPEYPMEDVDWEFHLRPYSDDQVQVQAFLSQDDEELDYVRVDSNDVWDQALGMGMKPWPADTEVLAENINLFGGISGYRINWTEEPLDDRLVRKALHHVIPTSYGADIAGGGYIPARDFCGLPRPIADEYLGVDWIEENLESYAVEETNEERATELLEEAEMEKEGGEWRMPDGSSWTIDLRGYDDDTRVRQAQVAQEQLQNFGINTDLNVQEQATFESNAFGRGNFDLAPGGWGVLGHPYKSYELLVQDVPTAKEGAGDAPNQTELWEVPMPIGNPDGEVEEINMREEVSALRTEGEDTDERVKLIAWAINQAVPYLPWSEGYQARAPHSMVDGNDWSRPEPPANTGWGSTEEYPSFQSRWGTEPNQE